MRQWLFTRVFNAIFDSIDIEKIDEGRSMVRLHFTPLGRLLSGTKEETDSAPDAVADHVEALARDGEPCEDCGEVHGADDRAKA